MALWPLSVPPCLSRLPRGSSQRILPLSDVQGHSAFLVPYSTWRQTSTQLAFQFFTFQFLVHLPKSQTAWTQLSTFQFVVSVVQPPVRPAPLHPSKVPIRSFCLLVYLVPVLGQSKVSTPFAPPQKFVFPHQPSHSVFKPQQQKCRTRQWFLQADHFSPVALLLRNLLHWEIISLRSISRPWFRPSEWSWSWSCVATRTRPRWPMLFLVFATVSIWGSTVHRSHSNLPQVTCPLPCFNLRLLTHTCRMNCIKGA